MAKYSDYVKDSIINNFTNFVNSINDPIKLLKITETIDDFKKEIMSDYGNDKEELRQAIIRTINNYQNGTL